MKWFYCSYSPNLWQKKTQLRIKRTEKISLNYGNKKKLLFCGSWDILNMCKRALGKKKEGKMF